METKEINEFKLGQFNVSRQIDGRVEKVLVRPLTQHDMMDRWNIVLPRKNKKHTIHHFNIILSQLPKHLWSRVWRNPNNSEYYHEIQDNIYIYSIRISISDNLLFTLYRELENPNPHTQLITRLYHEIDTIHHEDWIILQAKNIIDRSTQ